MVDLNLNRILQKDIESYDFNVSIKGTIMEKENSDIRFFDGPISVTIEYFTKPPIQISEYLAIHEIVDIPHQLKMECNFEKHKLHGLYYCIVQCDYDLENTMPDINYDLVYSLDILFYNHGIRDKYSLNIHKDNVHIYNNSINDDVMKIYQNHPIEKYTIHDEDLLNITTSQLFQSYPMFKKVGLTQRYFNLGIKYYLSRANYTIRMYIFNNVIEYKVILINNKHFYELQDNINYIRIYELYGLWRAIKNDYTLSITNLNIDPHLFHEERIYNTIFYMDDSNIIQYIYIPSNEKHNGYTIKAELSKTMFGEHSKVLDIPTIDLLEDNPDSQLF